MATILTFSTQEALRRGMPRHDMQAEVIVFPRTDVRALRRLSDGGAEAPCCGDNPPTARDDDGHA